MNFNGATDFRNYSIVLSVFSVPLVCSVLRFTTGW
jgi:hypothetical protein